MTRRLLVLALSALLLAAGCSGSDNASKKSTRSPTPSPTPLTQTQAKAIAAAGVVTPAELPGWEAEVNELDPDEEKDERALFTCMGATYPTHLAQDPGRAFTKDSLEIDSSVDVASTTAEARAAYDALGSSKGRTCIESETRAGFTELGATVDTATATPTQMTVPGSDATVAYALNVSAATPDGDPLTFHGYQLGALVGQTSIELSVFAEEGADYPLADATALLTEAVKRVQAVA